MMMNRLQINPNKIFQVFKKFFFQKKFFVKAFFDVVMVLSQE